MKLQFWGVRGAIPTPGRGYLRYGGNTCCTAVTGAHGELVVLDAGTGFCQLGDALGQGPFAAGQGEMALLLSHTHLDHILGFPFPGMMHRPGNRFTIYGPDSMLGSLETVCNLLLSPVYSPVYSLANIHAQQIFRSITTQPFTVGGLIIRAWQAVPGDETTVWSYRIEEGARSLVYITDVRYPDAETLQAAARFAHDADVLIHSAPYTRAEAVQDYGSSRVEDAIEVALLAQARTLLLFHHAPTRTDDQIDALLHHHRDMLAQRGATLQLDAAREGPVMEI